MQTQINTVSNIENHAELGRQIEAEARYSLDRFSEQVTQVEAHLGNLNSDKRVGSAVKRCLREARLARLQPISVIDRATTLARAIDGAVDQLTRSRVSTLGRKGKH